jgi:hypothetical protein
MHDRLLLGAGRFDRVIDGLGGQASCRTPPLNRLQLGGCLTVVRAMGGNDVAASHSGSRNHKAFVSVENVARREPAIGIALARIDPRPGERGSRRLRGCRNERQPVG